MLAEIITIATTEVVTGVDNAIAASAMLSTFNEKQRRFYLTWGLAIACLIPRLAIPAFLFALIEPSILMPICAYLLIGMVLNDVLQSFFKCKKQQQSTGWMSVVKLEAMDMLFSMEAVVAAMTITSELWIIFVGGVIGTYALREMTVRIADKLGKYGWLKYVAWVMILFIAFRMLI